jgi:hypothetical protein
MHRLHFGFVGQKQKKGGTMGVQNMPSSIVALFVLSMVSNLAGANSVTAICGTPNPNGVPGVVRFDLHVVVPFFTSPFEFNGKADVGPNDTAAQKCQAIADSLRNDISENILPDVSVTVSGNTMTVTSHGGDFLEGLAFTTDTSDEFTVLSSNISPVETFRVDEFFVPDTEQLPPPPDTFFSGLFEETPLFGTFGVTSNGVDNAATVLDHLNAQFTNLSGLQFNVPISDSNGKHIGDGTAWRDPPTTVAIGWDGNTAQYLANFGLEFQQPTSVAEPTTLALLGVGLAGLGFARRKRTQ